MPRQRSRKQFLNFVGGLNTESSPLVFPENTAKAIDNVDLRRDGSIKRRRGIDYEASGVLSSVSFSGSTFKDKAVSVHEWKSVNGDDSRNFLVVQVGGSLYFHKLGAVVLSDNYIGTISVAEIAVRDDYQEFVMSMDSAKGRLFIVSRGISPAYIEYDADIEKFTGVKLTIKVRDIDGIDEERDSPVIFGEEEITPVHIVDPSDDYLDGLTSLSSIKFANFTSGVFA